MIQSDSQEDPFLSEQRTHRKGHLGGNPQFWCLTFARITNCGKAYTKHFHFVTHQSTLVRSPVGAVGKGVCGLSSVTMNLDNICGYTTKISNAEMVSAAHSSWDVTVSDNNKGCISRCEDPRTSDQQYTDGWSSLSWPLGPCLLPHFDFST